MNQNFNNNQNYQNNMNQSQNQPIVPKKIGFGFLIKVGSIVTVVMILAILFIQPLLKESNNTEEEVTYHFVVEANDAAETVTTYDITAKGAKIEVKYVNQVTHPELLDGPSPKESNEFTISDSFFVEPLKQVLKTWDKERSSDRSMDDSGSLLLSTLEKSQNRNDDLCNLYGSWYCDINQDIMDLNSDGKITVEEAFSYYVAEIDSTITVVEDTRKPSTTTNKTLIPEKTPSTSSKRYKTNEAVNKIVLNGRTFEIGVSKLRDFLNHGFVIESDYEPTIKNSKQVRGYFQDNKDVTITLEFHTADYRTETAVEDCIVSDIDIKFASGSASKYFWKISDFVIDENTTKTEVNNYFNLSQNGSKTVSLYTPDFYVRIECGGIYETHEYSNMFSIHVSNYTENMTIPEWAE